MLEFRKLIIPEHFPELRFLALTKRYVGSGNEIEMTWIQVAEQTWYACARLTRLIRLSKRTKLRPSRNVKLFDGLQILANTTKHDQTAPNEEAKW